MAGWLAFSRAKLGANVIKNMIQCRHLSHRNRGLPDVQTARRHYSEVVENDDQPLVSFVFYPGLETGYYTFV
eukprot:824977-Prorocentrum_minimum.AAC.1